MAQVPAAIEKATPSLRRLAGTARMHWLRVRHYVKARVTWSRVFRTTSYAKSALWIVPFVAILLVLMLVPVLRALDAWLGWRLLGLGVSGAKTLYETAVTLALSFMVFTFGSLLVAIQVTGGQLTPRIIATTLLRDNVVRYTVGVFVFTLVFSVMALDRLEEQVLELVTFIIALLAIVCMASFLFLIDYAARLLRPVSIVARVGEHGLDVIKSVYPDPVSLTADPIENAAATLGTPHRIVVHSGRSGIVLAVNVEVLVSEAHRAGGVVELIPQVGDFIADQDPLFALYDGAARISDHRLRACVATGSERTLEQDPMFAFRILVDIALKALSPAINDPTTAVLAIDQIHRLLRAVGKRHLQAELVADLFGEHRVVYRTPNWEDYVHVACQEIRSCGAGSIQVARRLRAMLDNVIASLPEHRHAVVLDQRRRLDCAIEGLYPLPEDLALARIADSQGLGGSARTNAPRVR